MLPRLRASAKKAIGLLERRVLSSSKQSLKQVNFRWEIFKTYLESNIYFTSFSPQQLKLHPILFSPKQTNETSGFVRNQHKAELPPDAKATPAATPKPPSPSTTGAASSASSSSSVVSSWKFLPSISRDVRLLGAGALGVLGAGALLYSLGGSGDGGSGDKRESSKWKAESPFFNRTNEQTVFNKNLKGIPGVITVLVGPPSCGKSVRSAFFFFANVWRILAVVEMHVLC